jgi:uncharacterized membrane protein
MRMLLVGETWASVAFHQKGFSSYVTSGYEEGGQPLLDALAGHAEVVYVRNHEVVARFPDTLEELQQFAAVLFSDVGADTFHLHPETLQGRLRPNRLRLVERFVDAGGGFGMIGGWMSFGGFSGNAHYHRTPIEDILPVRISPWDDRAETPEGVRPTITRADHPILRDVVGEWPRMLGYNRLEAKPDAEVLATINGDPFLAVGRHGRGRTLAYASDCSPHWGPPEFTGWQHYGRLWRQLAEWLGG